MKIIFASINSRFFSSLSFLREFFLILYPGNLFLNPKMTFGFCFKIMVWVWDVSYTAYLMQDYLQLDLSISGLSMNLSNSIGCYPRQVFPLFRCLWDFIYNQVSRVKLAVQASVTKLADPQKIANAHKAACSNLPTYANPYRNFKNLF